MDYKTQIANWNNKELISEEDLIERFVRGEKTLEAIVEVELGSSPRTEMGKASFRGKALDIFVHAGFVGVGLGNFFGKDYHEVGTMTLYTKKGIRLWAESNDTDEFMDSASYLDRCRITNRRVKLGGLLDQNTAIPEFKFSYLFIEGPNGLHEERILLIKEDDKTFFQKAYSSAELLYKKISTAIKENI